jgi:hypothetical protein
MLDFQMKMKDRLKRCNLETMMRVREISSCRVRASAVEDRERA